VLTAQTVNPSLDLGPARFFIFFQLGITMDDVHSTL